MNKVLIKKETLKSIADAVRNKTGKIEELSTDEIIEDIENIPKITIDGESVDKDINLGKKSVNTFPKIYYSGGSTLTNPIIFNNQLYISRSSSGTEYIFDLSTCELIKNITTPTTMNDSGIKIVYQDKIHYIYHSAGSHFTYDGNYFNNSYSYGFGGGLSEVSAVVYDDKIYLFGSDTSKRKGICVFNGTSWTSLGTNICPYAPSQTVLVPDSDKIHLFGGYNSNTQYYHYTFNPSDNTFTQLPNCIYPHYGRKYIKKGNLIYFPISSKVDGEAASSHLMSSNKVVTYDLVTGEETAFELPCNIGLKDGVECYYDDKFNVICQIAPLSRTTQDMTVFYEFDLFDSYVEVNNG